MKKLWLRVCSVVLSLVMVCQLLPLQSFAEDLQTAVLQDTAQQNAEAVSQKEAEDAHVVAEIEEKRTEFSKEFLLSNGLHLATMYPDAVHYQTDNGWQEIDNTLKTNTDGTLSNTAGAWDVRFPQSLTEQNAIRITKDGYTLSFRMA